ncbi:MAG: PilN domain-containing protein [Gemmatimonadetes bacterium]|nr:PilN domain-containing protein [Gemmatimonadota bacterium]
MIEINLKPGQKRAKATSPLAGIGAQLKGLGQKIKDPYRIGALALGLGWLGYVGMAQLNTSGELAGLEPRLEQARAENQRFRAFLAEKKRLEAVRDSIQAQIATIKNVDGDRYGWPHILDEVARAVPAFTWLTDLQFIAVAPPVQVDTVTNLVVEPPPVQIQVSGRTVDIQGYTRLLRQLEDSPYLKDVTAISANTVLDQNRAVTAFVLKAAFQRPTRAEVTPDRPTTESAGHVDRPAPSQEN